MQSGEGAIKSWLEAWHKYIYPKTKELVDAGITQTLSTSRYRTLQICVMFADPFKVIEWIKINGNDNNAYPSGSRDIYFKVHLKSRIDDYRTDLGYGSIEITDQNFIHVHQAIAQCLYEDRIQYGREIWFLGALSIINSMAYMHEMETDEQKKLKFRKLLAEKFKTNSRTKKFPSTKEFRFQKMFGSDNRDFYLFLTALANFDDSLHIYNSSFLYYLGYSMELLHFEKTLSDSDNYSVLEDDLQNIRASFFDKEYEQQMWPSNKRKIEEVEIGGDFVAEFDSVIVGHSVIDITAFLLNFIQIKEDGSKDIRQRIVTRKQCEGNTFDNIGTFCSILSSRNMDIEISEDSNGVKEVSFLEFDDCKEKNVIMPYINLVFGEDSKNSEIPTVLPKRFEGVREFFSQFEKVDMWGLDLAKCGPANKDSRKLAVFNICVFNV